VDDHFNALIIHFIPEPFRDSVAQVVPAGEEERERERGRERERERERKR